MQVTLRCLSGSLEKHACIQHHRTVVQYYGSIVFKERCKRHHAKGIYIACLFKGCSVAQKEIRIGLLALCNFTYESGFHTIFFAGGGGGGGGKGRGEFI